MHVHLRTRTVCWWIHLLLLPFSRESNRKNQRRFPEHLRGLELSDLFNYTEAYVCLAARWTARSRPDTHHQTHQSEVCEQSGDEDGPRHSSPPNTGGWRMLQKLWCHVRGGKPSDMFGLRFKQTKRRHPRNSVSSNSFFPGFSFSRQVWSMEADAPKQVKEKHSLSCNTGSNRQTLLHLLFCTNIYKP